MEHSERDRVVQEFRDGATKILIATDVLSRGFDVSQERIRPKMFHLPWTQGQRCMCNVHDASIATLP
eukprot:1145810-Pelagomonas_calceolata.AAC.2